MTVEVEKKSANLPWVEKYRPKTLEDLISKDDIVRTINKFIAEDQLPHLLLYGPPGTGKTSTIIACARKLYTPGQFQSMVLELNASDDRGIGIVRGAILSFASTKTIFNKGFKLIILDEADAMTNDAQNALRRIIEKYTDNVRFCIICNYLGKIIPALQSRCTRFRFAPLVPAQIMPRLEHVIQEEKVDATEDGKTAVLTLGGGDMRRVLNILQSTSLSLGQVNEENVYTCVGHPLQADIKDILNSLLNDDINASHTKIRYLQTLKGIALTDIVSELHDYTHRIDLPAEVVCDMLITLADIEHRLAQGTNENLQLCALIAEFHHARHKTAALAKPEEAE